MCGKFTCFSATLIYEFSLFFCSWCNKQPFSARRTITNIDPSYGYSDINMNSRELDIHMHINGIRIHDLCDSGINALTTEIWIHWELDKLYLYTSSFNMRWWMHGISWNGLRWKERKRMRYPGYLLYKLIYNCEDRILFRSFHGSSLILFISYIHHRIFITSLKSLR